MLKYDELWLTIPKVERFNERTQTFEEPLFPDTTIQLKHSLISVAKWERKWHVRFLGNTKKTPEMVLDYVKCMTMNSNVKDEVYNYLSEAQLKEIHDYIENPMTATGFMDLRDENEKASDSLHSEKQSAETLYADMIMLNIPVEFQKWHLNSLLTLIRVCANKQNPQKGKKEDVAAYYAKLKAAKRAAKAKGGR